MAQKWIQLLGILVFCQNITSGSGEERTIKEGEQVGIQCKPSLPGTMIIWFRVLDTSGMEFIASFSNTGIPKTPSQFPSNFKDSLGQDNDMLTLKSFNKIRDSGYYSCASLKGSELKFGKVTRLVGEKVEVPAEKPPTTTTEQNLITTPTPCACNYNPGETRSELFCSLIILGPLAGGCGLCLLLLVITIVYCNHIRTRRCPHHYKRKPLVVTPGKQMMTNPRI